MLVLGLDISTSCTGWCVLEQNDTQSHSLVKLGFIPMSNIKDPYRKSQKVRDELLKLKKDYNIDKVFIEENLQSFRSGMSSARTLVTLARFNGVVSYISESVFKTTPVFINVNSARKSLGIKIIKKSIRN